MAKKIAVRMATAMAGADFSHAPGDIVSVDAKIAEAWLEAAIATLPPAAAAAERDLAEALERIAALEADLAEASADRDALREQAEQLGGQVAELQARIAAQPATPTTGA